MIDNLIVFAYLVLVLAMGIYYRSHSGSFKGFANVKDSVRQNKILLIATVFAASIGGGTTFGISEKAFSSNIAYSYALIFTIPVDLLIAIYVIPKLVKHYGSESIGDIMVNYYGQQGRFISGISAILVSIGFLAAQISVSGRIFQYILQINFAEGVILSYGVVIIYTTIGGLRSVIFTNFLQFVATLIAIPVISIIGLYKIGIVNFVEQVPVDKFSFHNSNLFSTTISAILGFAVMGLYPNFIQRAIINKDPIVTKRAIFVKSAIYFVFLIFITINGLIAYNLFPDQPSSQSLTYLIDQTIPVGLRGIVVAGLLAAAMSTADSDLNISAITLVKDIINPILAIKNEKNLLLIARIANIFIGSLAIIIALSFNSVVDLVVFVAGFWSPMIVVPLLFALYDITISVRGMIFSSLSGGLSFALWEYFRFLHQFDLKGVFIGSMVSLLLFLAIYKTQTSGKNIKNSLLD